jgi:ornithine--oxo-acid transaminase
MRHLGASPLGLACLASEGLRQRLVAVGGEEEGRCYEVLDASGGYASACLGAAHPLFARVFPELWRCAQVTAELGTLERSRFLLDYFGAGGHWADRFPDGEYQVSGRNSGSEGMELALRLVLQSNWDSCRRIPLPGREGRSRILVFEGAWHGWTHAAQALLNRRQFRVGLPGSAGQGPYGFKVSFLPFGEPALLENFFAEHGHELAAVLVEPIQGDAGRA